VAQLLEQHPGADVATLAVPIDSVEEFLDPNASRW
jgi:hypothetical protein